MMPGGGAPLEDLEDQEDRGLRARGASLWQSTRAALAWFLGAAGVWILLAALLPKGLPLGIVLLGIVYGAIYAILAVGIVLIYRGDRIINFAQAAIGVLPAVLAIELVVTYGVPFVLAAGAGIAAAIILGALASLLPRHFRNSSRLILTVATIGLAQLLTGLAAIAPVLFCNPATNQSCVNASNSQSVNTPLHVSFTIGPVLFSGNDIVAVVGGADRGIRPRAVHALLQVRARHPGRRREQRPRHAARDLGGPPRHHHLGAGRRPVHPGHLVAGARARVRWVPDRHRGRRRDPAAHSGRRRDRSDGEHAADRGGGAGHRRIRRRGDLDLLQHDLRRRLAGGRHRRGPPPAAALPLAGDRR